ncbi:MAG: epoxyqueuosine reductase QueH [Eubacterium sp.]|nr:epoxyqueuosine reductase QueH [Eubacterium sp.]MBR2278766.1 epoxyqueuosine reductase QueH [Eubacterium sp.]
MNKVNYQKETDKIIDSITSQNAVPRLLLHSCCAPCSSYTLEYLSQYFAITVFYFNPNISPQSEFEKRFAEQKRLVESLPAKNKIELVKGEYDYNVFLEIAKGLEDVREGGERCFKCYRMRLEQTAALAKEQGFDYFCTTLSISPLKNSQKINEIGFDIAEKYGVKWLPSDFKKREGYKRSIELSREYDLYRQNFCGCVYSKA